MKKSMKWILAVMIPLMVQLGCELYNNPPTIEIFPEDDSPLTSSTQTLTAVASDPEEDVLTITWSATAGEFSKRKGEIVMWTAPQQIQEVTITAVADDRKIGGVDSSQVVLAVNNMAPIITDYKSDESSVYYSGSVSLDCSAYDADDEAITYEFYTSPYGVGTFAPRKPEDNTATWEAPSAESFSRLYDLIVEVIDEQGYSSRDTLDILVYSEYGTIWIVDSYEQTVSKYTSRGIKVLTSPYLFKEPVAIVNYIYNTPGYYVADHTAGQIVHLDATGKKVYIHADLPNVIDLAIHHDTRTLWAVSVSPDEPRLTVIYIPDNSVIKEIRGLRQPSAIAVNQIRDEIWIADMGDGDRIIQLDVEGVLAGTADTLTSANANFFTGNFNSPVNLFIQNEAEATLYIADHDDGQIERLSYNVFSDSYSRVTPVNLATGAKPIGVGITSAGQIWILNFGDGTLIEYAQEDGLPTAQWQPLLTSYPFTAPYTMTIDPEYGHLWIGDNGTHQVVQVVGTDSVGVVIGGFSFVKDIAINK